MSMGRSTLESRFQPWLLPGVNLRGGFDLANLSPTASPISRTRPLGHGRFLWTEIPKGQSDPLKGRSTRGHASDPHDLPVASVSCADNKMSLWIPCFDADRSPLAGGDRLA
jgi:hypothetical protein